MLQFPLKRSGFRVSFGQLKFYLCVYAFSTARVLASNAEVPHDIADRQFADRYLQNVFRQFVHER